MSLSIRHILDASGIAGVITGPDQTVVTRFRADSRRIEPGDAFVALGGETFDGHEFIDAALALGAAIVVAEVDRPEGLDAGITWVHVDSTHRAFGPLAGAMFGKPSEQLRVLAVTGTNGKTTVAWLLAHILDHTGFSAGISGTVLTRIAGVERTTVFTTPFPAELQELLAEMVAAGCTHAVLEASSHGLEQDRLWGTTVAVGGFTNLTRDHIDYHGSMEAYRDAKALLFQRYAQAACFNIDDAVGAELAAGFAGTHRTVSVQGAEADLSLDAFSCHIHGSRLTLRAAGGLDPLNLHIKLVGRHNIENAMVALGMATLAGVELHAAAAALETALPAPGRLERVDGPRHVFVDYAHTPDALANVLGTLRPLVDGALICVFGAGGDRDRGKRPEMGRVVASLADVPVVTSDNPRSEPPVSIIDDIVAGMPGDEGDRMVEPDRRAAIELAIRRAGPADLVLIAGKGHEPYQVVGDQTLDFDDRVEARRVLTGLRGDRAATGGAA